MVYSKIYIFVANWKGLDKACITNLTYVSNSEITFYTYIINMIIITHETCNKQCVKHKAINTVNDLLICTMF